MKIFIFVQFRALYFILPNSQLLKYLVLTYLITMPMQTFELDGVCTLFSDFWNDVIMHTTFLVVLQTHATIH